MLTVGGGMAGFVVTGCGLGLPDLNLTTLILTGLGLTALGVANYVCDAPCTFIASLGVADWACDVLDMAGGGMADLARDGPIMAEWGVTALGGAGLDRDMMVEGPGTFYSLLHPLSHLSTTQSLLPKTET
ncbi:hypothetical protein Pcinc_014326 [Petrolisthes cinctipes]|uniref:Uncharacterized protein n=1 Tax=Petrolisthes cinctipes TaxID=88211 RepID=A0AAE1KQT8_PETCI|nr:hypothetical protein Pcinc_039344 [Petrolisthes cinctipes]KAK3881244.1 hypothetical protein Pcinc_014326 [Petrolisthes cinctipes]